MTARDDIAVKMAVHRMLAGELHAINELPRRLRAAAQSRYTEGVAAATHHARELQRADPNHAGPTPGLS